MRAVHLVIGYAVVGGFALLWLWGMVTLVVRRGPGQPFWWLLGGVQAILLAQGIVGVVLLFSGLRASALHYVYGVIFPILVLLVAHVLAREAFAHRPWLPFAWAAFFAFGLTLRALMTGLGYP